MLQNNDHIIEYNQYCILTARSRIFIIINILQMCSHISNITTFCIMKEWLQKENNKLMFEQDTAKR